MRTSAKRLSLVSLLAISAAAAAGVQSSKPANAEVVTCGQTITASVTLSADLGPCFNDGLVVKASDITVDLGGHSIIGGSKGTGTTPDQVGIRLDHVTGVTVRSGTVRGFYAGVLIDGGSANTVTGMTATQNLGTGPSAYGDGIALDNRATQNSIVHNTVTANGPHAGIHMLHESSQNSVASNLVTDNDLITPPDQAGADPLEQDSGIAMDDGSSFNRIVSNTVLRSSQFGIKLAGVDTSHNQASGNVIRENGNYGINAGGNGHLVSGNTIDHNGYEQFVPAGGAVLPTFDGGVVTCGQITPPCGPDFTTIENNRITNNNGPGIALVFNGFQLQGGTGVFGTFPPRPYVAPRSNLVQGNDVLDNHGDGIYIECDQLYDASFNPTCLPSSLAPPHQGQRILKNVSLRNGGASAGQFAFDLHDGNPDCDHDIWSGNTALTASPPCTLSGTPTPVPTTPSSTTTSTSTPSITTTSTSTPSSTTTSTSTTSTVAPTSTTSTTAPNSSCAQQIAAQRAAFNAQLDQQEQGQPAAVVAALEASRSQVNQSFDQQLAACR